MSGVAIALYIVMFVITQFGLVSHINRIPQQEDIYEVWIAGPSPFRDGCLFRHPVAIELVRTGHRHVLEERPRFFTTWNRIGQEFRVTIVYVLHDGQKITRYVFASQEVYHNSGLSALHRVW